MRNLKTLSLALILMFASSAAFAYGVKLNGASKPPADVIDFKAAAGTDILTTTGMIRAIPVVDSSMFATGTGNGGATSVASTTVAVPVTFSFVRKVITSNADAAFTAGTLANGKPGQLLTVYVAGLTPGGATTGGNYTITPTTTTGFTSIKLTAVNDYVTFLFVDSTTGWILFGYHGTVTIVLKG